MSTVRYQIAGHSFSICAASAGQVEDWLPAFAPFAGEECTAEPLLFTLTVCPEVQPEGVVLHAFEREGAAYVVRRAAHGAYFFEITIGSTGLVYAMRASADFRDIRVQLHACAADAYVLNNCVMIAYAFASASRHTLMMHASVVEKDGFAYLFLGKSGTGKSTHSGLWMQHVAGTQLLNDDNPIVRIVDGKPLVYGSPWSGKTPCYRNAVFQGGALVSLVQARANRIRRLDSLAAFARLLPSCSLLKWDERVYGGVCSTLSDLLELLPSYELACLPDADAARLSYNTIRAV